MNPKKPRRSCLVCGKEVKGVKDIYCSIICSGQNKVNRIIEDWKVNPESANTISGLSPTIRRFLIKEANDKCQKCGFEGYNESTGNSILEVDHKDGNCHNNSPENLRVICPNCHAMSPNYKALNKNSGRKYRNK